MRWDIHDENIQEAVNWNLNMKTLDGAAESRTYVRTEYLEKAGTGDFDTFIKEKVDPVFPLGMSYEDWKKKAYEIEGRTLQAGL